jgi:hypothetical protein
MSKSSDVLEHLIPTGGWSIIGDDFDSITYDDGVKPVTKKQFDDAYKIIDSIKENQVKAKEAQRQAIADRLGLTADELKVLLG